MRVHQSNPSKAFMSFFLPCL